MRVWQETEVEIVTGSGIELNFSHSLTSKRVPFITAVTVQAFWRPIEQPREFKRNKTRHLICADGRATGPQRTTRLTGKPW